MKLQHIIQEAQSIHYLPKTGEKDNWDLIYESIWLAIHNETQTRTLFILSNMLYPIKVISKSLIKIFIKNHTESYLKDSICKSKKLNDDEVRNLYER